MKRLLSLSVAIIVVLTLAMPSTIMAQEDKGLEKAITKAKALLEIPDTYDSFRYNMYKNGENVTVYSLSWSDSKGKLGEISATIDSNGRITNYYRYKPYDISRERSRLPSINKEDAQKAADDFIQKVDSSVYKKIKYQINNSPISIQDVNYHFYYMRIENGILFPENGVNVSVNNRTGEIQSYYLNWTEDILFPSSSGVLSLKKAQETYTEELGLKLAYKLKYDDDKVSPYLVYTNVYSGRSIDAKTGEIVYGNNYYAMGNGMDAAKEEMAKSANTQSANLSPEEKKAVENMADFIDQQKAEKTAREVLELDNSFKLNNINLYNSWQNKEDYIWNMSFAKEEKKDAETRYYHASISLNAKTGDVVDFYKSMPYEQNFEVEYDKEKSLKIASDFIRSMQPEKYKDAEYTNWDEPQVQPLSTNDQPRQYYFKFTRKAGNAYFLENGFNVTVDAVTGNVISYSFAWYNGELPSADKAIDFTKAHEILFMNVGIELRYITRYPDELYTKIIPEPGNTKPEVKLVYALNNEKPSNIDALTGELLDYSGKPYSERIIANYTDIEKSFAKNQIKVLAEFGISLPGKEFKPNSSITQRDFLYLLAKSLNYYTDFVQESDDADEVLYNFLTSQGIVKDGEKSPSSLLTKQDGVKFVIRAMGLDRAADVKGIYKLPFKDAGSIDHDLYGYVALAYGLEIVKDDGGYFKPSGKLTRADGAVMVYNFLNAN